MSCIEVAICFKGLVWALAFLELGEVTLTQGRAFTVHLQCRCSTPWSAYAALFQRFGSVRCSCAAFSSMGVWYCRQLQRFSIICKQSCTSAAATRAFCSTGSSAFAAQTAAHLQCWGSAVINYVNNAAKELPQCCSKSFLQHWPQCCGTTGSCALSALATAL